MQRNYCWDENAVCMVSWVHVSLLVLAISGLWLPSERLRTQLPQSSSEHARISRRRQDSQLVPILSRCSCRHTLLSKISIALTHTTVDSNRTSMIHRSDEKASIRAETCGAERHVASETFEALLEMWSVDDAQKGGRYAAVLHTINAHNN